MPMPEDSGRSPAGDSASQPDGVDQGRAGASGAQPEQPPAPCSPSVLRLLQARTAVPLGVHLDADESDAAPVKVTGGAKQLRDPSGRYHILGEVGRGGMGVVYKGRDQDLGRDVAIKVLRDEFADRPDVLARFVEEAQIGGQLQHPGIVPVYDLGLQAGQRPYFAMKLVKGETLAAQLLRRSDPAQDRRRLLGVFEQVCQTMAYAHARFVVHRDLKPANVMIGAFGEVQVVDWGMAKVLPKGGVADEQAAAARDRARSVIETVRSQPGSGSQSVIGSMLGTPAYMPPEQAIGDIERLDQRSDVFGLGAILCEILTGSPPYREADGDVVRQAATGALEGACQRLQQCGADAVLVALATECLARVQRARPASAAEVARRVGEYLTSVEERARQAEVRAAEARYRTRMTLLSVAAVAAVLVLAAGAWLWHDSDVRARRGQVMERIAAARNSASGSRGQALAAGQDPQLWAAALASAGQVVALCQDEAVDPDVRADAAALLASVQRDQQAADAEAKRRARDTAMRERLEQLRIPADHDLRRTGIREGEYRRLDAAYAAAFADYLGGRSLFEQEPGAVLASLRQGDLAHELAASLDHWGLARDGLRTAADAPDPAGTARLRALALQLDPDDPWRSRLRSLLPDADTEGARLRALADQADFAALSAAGCRVLGEALWRASEKDAAIAVLQRGQELHPEDFDLCFSLGGFLEQLEKPRWQAAVEAYRIAQALRPRQNAVLHRLGIVYGQLGRHGDVERLFRILLARQPQDVHWLVHLARSLRLQGRQDEGAALVAGAIARGPHDALTEQLLSAEFYEQGRYEECVASCRRALEIDPRNAGIHYALAIALLKQGRVDEGVASLERALEIDPRNVQSLYSLGFARITQGRFDEAVTACRRALEIDPHCSHARTNLGCALTGLGRREAAIEEYRRVIADDPGFRDAHRGLGDALAQQDKVEEAIASYRRALEIDPRCIDVEYCLGNLLSAQGMLDAAVASFHRMLEIDPRRVEAHVNLGVALQKQGNLEDGIASVRRGLEIDPRHIWALNTLGWMLQRQGKPDEAAASYRRALEIEPRFGLAHTGLGETLLGQGRLDEAIASYERAVELDPQDAMLRQSLDHARGMLRGRSAAEPVLRGERMAANAEEFQTAVDLGADQERYQELVTMAETTLARAPQVIGDEWSTYGPACAAALLAAGDKPALAAAERVRIRGLARTWLSRAADTWRKRLGEDGASAVMARQRLVHALKDPDFASVRGAAIASLPEGERTAWQQTWAPIEQASKAGER